MESIKGDNMNIRITCFETWYKPEFKTPGSAGADLKARGDWNINPGEVIKIPLGFSIEIPYNYTMFIRPRSGLSLKSRIVAIEGTIDSDYRGEVCAIIENRGKDIFSIRDGDRIAQGVILPVVQPNFNIVPSLSETSRNLNGFGSTGL